MDFEELWKNIKENASKETRKWNNLGGVDVSPVPIGTDILIKEAVKAIVEMVPKEQSNEKPSE